MNKQTLSGAKLLFLLVPLTLAVLALACGGSATIPITLSEADVNRIIRNSYLLNILAMQDW